MRLLVLLFLTILIASCSNSNSQDTDKTQLIGQCEGCEAIFEYGDRSLQSVDTLPDFRENGQKIALSGTVYQPDGKTPAKDVILYVYHTNQKGLYAPKENASGWARRHGYIRSWMKTDSDGKYRFYTLKPAPYPNRTDPAHIHLIVLEPDGKYYWLGSYHFAGDPLLTEKETHPVSTRGGSSGLLKLEKKNDIWYGTRDIILGKNVPGYD